MNGLFYLNRHICDIIKVKTNYFYKYANTKKR